MIKILSVDGKLIEYQGTKLGNYFSLNEWRFQEDLRLYGELIVSKLLMEALDEFRERINEPLHITSFNRSEEKQAQLNNDPRYKAATNSPHVVKLAADIVPNSISILHPLWKESKDELIRKPIITLMKNYYLRVLEKVSIDLGIKIRIGLDQYLHNDQSFFHVDVCPEYYAKGKVWHEKSHPEPWEREARW